MFVSFSGNDRVDGFVFVYPQEVTRVDGCVYISLAVAGEDGCVCVFALVLLY